MATEVTEAAVRARLAEIQDPELHRSIVELGMIGEIEIEGGSVSVDLRLTTAGCPFADFLARRVREAAAAVPGVTDVEVHVGACP